MEYLTTYGWAFLLIAIVIVSLIALGVFYPNTYVRNTCIMQADFSCLGTILSYNGLLQITIQQSTSSPINITAIGCNTQYTTNEISSIVPNVYLPIGANATFFVQCYNGQTAWAGSVGTLFNGYLLLNYTSIQYPYPQTTYGSLTLKVSVPKITTSTVSTSTTSTSSTSTSTTSTSTTSIPQSPTLYLNSVGTTSLTVPAGEQVTALLTCYNTYPKYSNCQVVNITGGGTIAYPPIGTTQACLGTCYYTFEPIQNLGFYAQDTNYTGYYSGPVSVTVQVVQPSLAFSPGNIVYAGQSVTVTATCNQNQPCNLESPEGNVICTGSGSCSNTVADPLANTIYWANDLTFKLQANNKLIVQVIQPYVTFQSNPIVAGSNTIATAVCNQNQPCNLESPEGNVICTGSGSCSNTVSPPTNTIYWANDLTFNLHGSNTLVVQIQQPYVTFGQNPIYYGYNTIANAICSPGSTCALESPEGTDICSGPKTTSCSSTVSPTANTVYWANDMTNHLQNSLTLNVLEVAPSVSFSIPPLYAPSGYPSNAIGYGWKQTDIVTCTPSTDGCSLSLGSTLQCSVSGYPGTCSSTPQNSLTCSAYPCYFTYNGLDSINNAVGQNTIEMVRAPPTATITVPSQDQPPGYPSNTIYYGYGANVIASCNPQADLLFDCALQSPLGTTLETDGQAFSTGPITSAAPWAFFANDLKNGLYTENVLNVVRVAPTVTILPSNIVSQGNSATATITCTPSQDAPCNLYFGSTLECSTSGCSYTTPTTLQAGSYTFTGNDVFDGLSASNTLQIVTPPTLMITPNIIELDGSASLTATCSPNTDYCAIYYGSQLLCGPQEGSCSTGVPTSLESTAGSYTFNAYDSNRILTTQNTLTVLPIPLGLKYYANISVTNKAANIVTGKGMPLAITLQSSPASLWGSSVVGTGTTLENIEFFYPSNGTIADSWLEGVNGSENESISSSESQLIYWIKLNPQITAGATATNVIAIGFSNLANPLINNINTGEAPQLSCATPSNPHSGCGSNQYGEFDDGANVFTFYYNFPNTSWSNINSFTEAGPVYSGNGLIIRSPGNSQTGLGIASVQNFNINDSTLDFYGLPPFSTGSQDSAVAVGWYDYGLYCPLNELILYGQSAGNSGFYFQQCANKYAISFTEGRHVGVWSIGEARSGVSGQWDGVASWDYGNYYVENSSITETNPNAPVNFTILYQGTSTVTGVNGIGAQWIRVRLSPPNMLMPSVKFGSLQTVP